jgi:glucokinase
MRGMIAGIDLGGTQVRVGLARPDGQIVSSARTRTALLDSPERLCGQHGRVEAFCGGGSLSRQTGESTAELFQAASPGDREAAAIVGRAASYMGHALVSLTNLIDPEVVVIGGGISRSWKQVAPVFLSVLRGSPFIKPGRRPRVRRSQLGDRAGQVGAVEWARTHH